MAIDIKIAEFVYTTETSQSPIEGATGEANGSVEQTPKSARKEMALQQLLDDIRSLRGFKVGFSQASRNMRRRT